MAGLCDDIERFADGEMPPAEAEAFRDHLLECANCRVQLENLLQLDLLVARNVEKRAPEERPSQRPPRPRWQVIAAFAAVWLVLAAGGVFFSRRGTAGDPWLQAEPERRIEMRLAYVNADRHRPLAARKMGAGEEAGGKLPLETLAALERKGDAAGLAAALLVRDDNSLAEQALARLASLPNSPEIETDRAAAYLAKGEPQEALRHLERALEAAPRLGPALWNRALALSALDLRRSAARAFEQVANLGEPGWADEARKRASELASAEDARVQRWKAANNTTPPPEVLALQERAKAQLAQGELDEAWAHAERARSQLRATNELSSERLTLGLLAEIAQLRNDLPLARAYREEQAEWDRGDER